MKMISLNVLAGIASDLSRLMACRAASATMARAGFAPSIFPDPWGSPVGIDRGGRPEAR
jgi:hypothetical protein